MRDGARGESCRRGHRYRSEFASEATGIAQMSDGARGETCRRGHRYRSDGRQSNVECYYVVDFEQD